MLISPTPSQPLQSNLAENMPAASRQDTPNKTKGAGLATAAPANPAKEPAKIAEGEHVTLSATASTPSHAQDSVPLYAEIWKNGVKVAEIDIQGGVNPLNGLVAAAPGSIRGGPLLAARRAAEIVRSIGGEIRVGGQILDTQTLDMRARLKIAYGI